MQKSATMIRCKLRPQVDPLITTVLAMTRAAEEDSTSNSAFVDRPRSYTICHLGRWGQHTKPLCELNTVRELQDR